MSSGAKQHLFPGSLITLVAQSVRVVPGFCATNEATVVVENIPHLPPKVRRHKAVHRKSYALGQEPGLQQDAFREVLVRFFGEAWEFFTRSSGVIPIPSHVYSPADGISQSSCSVHPVRSARIARLFVPKRVPAKL